MNNKLSVKVKMETIQWVSDIICSSKLVFRNVNVSLAETNVTFLIFRTVSYLT